MRQKSRGLLITAVMLAFTIGAALVMTQEKKGGGDETGPYELVKGWPQNMCGPGYMPGSAAGIFAESPDKVFLFQRGCLPEMTGRDVWGEQSVVPARNASGYDLSQEDKARHPRWDHNLVILNRDGKMIDSWEQHNHLFVRPHKVLISPYDPEKHVWIVDDGAHQLW